MGEAKGARTACGKIHLGVVFFFFSFYTCHDVGGPVGGMSAYTNL